MAQQSTLGNDLHSGARSIGFVARRRTFFIITITLILASLALIFGRGLNPGIDFQGGSQFTISGTDNLDQDPAASIVEDVDGQPPRVATVGSDSLRVQTGELSSEQTVQVRSELAEAYNVPESDVTSTFVGPTWGADVTSQAIWSLVIFLSLVTIVMTVYFRAWTFSLAALGALLHDLVLTVGIYALIGFEVTPATVIGFLTILAYSLYDTVVVFDKVRENTEGLFDQEETTYAEASNLAINQTLVRSLNTSITGLLPIAAIIVVGVILLGAGTLRDIALALFVGMALSTISSIVIAAPLEVSLRLRQEAYRDHTERVLAARANADDSLPPIQKAPT